MMREPPRRRLPRWVSTLVVVSVAAVFLIPGMGRPVERVGSTVLAPVQMGLSETLGEAANFVETIQRVRILASESFYTNTTFMPGKQRNLSPNCVRRSLPPQTNG